MGHENFPNLRAMLIIMLLLGGLQMVNAQTIYDFDLMSPDGRELTLESFRGKVLMIVNTASKCGFTGQYKDLQEIYDRFADQGFVVLGFPANSFMNQEPGTNEEIIEFCQLNYGVSFPMFAKISVKGKDIHPLYKYLTSKDTNPHFGGSIGWNFTKFLVSKDGEIIDRYRPTTNPSDPKVIRAIEAALQ